MGWIPLPFIILPHPFPISHYYSIPVSPILISTPLFPFPLNAAIEGLRVRLRTLSERSESRLQKLEATKYTRLPRSPKWEGTRPMGRLDRLRLCQHLRPSGVLSCWPDGLELTPGFYPRSNEQHRLFWAST